MLIIVGLVTIISTYLFFKAPITFTGEDRFIARQEPSQDKPDVTIFTFDRYYNWFGSEFLVDDYTQIVQSEAFAKSMLSTSVLANTPVILGRGSTDPLLPGMLRGVLEADRKQRELRVRITGTSIGETSELAKAVAMVLTDAKLKPISGQMVNDKPVFTQIDAATADQIKSSKSKEAINAAIRVAIGLVAALAFAFLLEYLDGSLRDERDAQRILELPVIGAIPRA